MAKLRMGMYVQARYASAWLSLPNYLPQVLESGVDTRLIILCTDDNHPNTLVSEGGMDRALRAVLECGCDPVTALQFATINAAQCLGVDQDMGSITPGKCADMVVLPNLETFPSRFISTATWWLKTGRPRSITTSLSGRSL